MVDTPTALADVIVPEIFNPYFVEASTELNAFWQSGVVRPVPELNFGSRGGTEIQMPYWKQIDEDAQLLDDTADLSVKKVQTGQDKAVQHARALVFGGTDLAAALAGSDPMVAIAGMVAQNWSNVMTTQLINTLKGAMGALGDESPTVNLLDISALSGTAAHIDGASFVDACQQLGDAKTAIVAVAMHSAVEAHLLKNDLIEFVRDSEGKEVMRTFQGKRVIVDDALTATSSVYTTWLFGDGAIGYGEGNPKVPSEVQREALKNGGEDILVTRRHFVLHPRGVKWDPASGVPAAPTPSDAELADIGNWTRCYEPKNIRLVQFKHKVA